MDDLADSPAFRRRATRIMERHALAIVDAVDELGRLGLVASAAAQVRSYPATPLFKLYVLNRERVFFGYYPVRESKLELDGESTAIWDLMGKDAMLFQYSRDADPDSSSSQFVDQSQVWFDSIWNSVARDYRP
ncbi:hypothetical protein [Nocardia carnea]|uniref:Uncharacterized protein n=1 Tax=Nocardia carnea TaxID=37328 RepID=A0ABW7TWH3_9NOCA|nr:hypothetical protein [Nocardia carnea]